MYPVFCDFSGEWIGRHLKEVKEHVLLDIFVFLQKPPNLIHHWSSIMMDAYSGETRMLEF